MRLKPFILVPALVLAGAAGGAGAACAQCLLANPSFEIAGSGGAACAGWNQFGNVGATSEAVHGSRAARVTGPDTGGWAVSGFWQPLDTVEGERWAVTGHVFLPAAQPLTGPCTAIVNVEWRDAADALISYDSYPVADAASAADTWLDFALTSTAAPAGAVTARLLLGVLQGPTDPAPDVYYDQVTFASTSPPTLDDLQWDDFPGGTTLDFAGRTWRVKGPGVYGPGTNIFCNATVCTWVDDQGRLHLTLANHGGNWYATEVVAEDALGYGDYVVTTEGRLDTLDPLAVFGIFLWQYGPCYDPADLWWNPYDEIDIEYGRWTDPGADIGQFVAQPYDWTGNLTRFDTAFADGETVSHAMRWLPDRVEYRVWRGGPDDESPPNTIASWTYRGPHIPRPEQPRLHLNLWRIEGAPAADQEVTVADFRFVPAGAASAVGDGAGALPGAPAGRLLPAAPNPFNPRTTVSFRLDRPGRVELTVFDPAGRRVRTLAAGTFAAGDHGFVWDGRDARGGAAASGIYLVVLRGEGFVESRRVALVR